MVERDEIFRDESMDPPTEYIAIARGDSCMPSFINGPTASRIFVAPMSLVRRDAVEYKYDI